MTALCPWCQLEIRKNNWLAPLLLPMTQPYIIQSGLFTTYRIHVIFVKRYTYCQLRLTCVLLVDLSLFSGEKQAAVHHDQWNAARAANHHAGFAEFYAVFVNFLLHIWRSYYSLWKLIFHRRTCAPSLYVVRARVSRQPRRYSHRYQALQSDLDVIRLSRFVRSHTTTTIMNHTNRTNCEPWMNLCQYYHTL